MIFASIGVKQMKALLEKCDEFDNIIIFGAGSLGKIIWDTLSKTGLSSVHLCDSNKAGQVYNRVKILSPDNAHSQFPLALWIVGAEFAKNAIVNKIKSFGISEDRIVNGIPEEIIFQLNEAEAIRRTTPQKRLATLDYHLTEHCNLKCRGCLHFSSIACDEFTLLEVFKKDLQQMSELLEGSLGTLILLGGEPLLNENLTEFLRIGRMSFINIGVTMATNGILLDSMDENFWKSCRENRINISVSGYPIKLNTESIKEKAQRYGVHISFAEKENVWEQYVLDLDGLQNREKSFKCCPQANKCVQLRKGRLYPCSITAGIEHFNRKFGKNLLLSENDSLDIYSASSSDEVYNFCSTPVPFCRYCDMLSKKVGADWSITKGEINEWT